MVEYWRHRPANGDLMNQGKISIMKWGCLLGVLVFNQIRRGGHDADKDFPSSIIARRYGFKEGEFIELDNVAERAAPQFSF